MSTDPPIHSIEINGTPADVDGLRTPALINYGHFSSMQAYAGGVRGLDLHLHRLAEATRELFATELDVAQVRAWMRKLAGSCAGLATLRVNVFSHALDRDRPIRPAAPDVMIAIAPAREIAATPLRVCSARYARELPHIKHVGTFGLMQQKRSAQARGYDDVVFVDAQGTISEASIWNIGFFDDHGVVWPDAPALRGVSLQLLQRGLRERAVASSTRSVALSNLSSLRGAFFTNTSRAVMPIAAIDDIAFELDASRIALLEECYSANPWQPI